MISTIKEISKGEKQRRGPTLDNKSSHPTDKKEPTTQRGGARAARQKKEHVQGSQEVRAPEEPGMAGVQ